MTSEKEHSLLLAARFGELDKVKKLLAENVNVNCANIHGFTPCHEAVYSGHTAIVKLLIVNGADINKRTKMGRAPCHWATENGQLETLKLLVYHGAIFDSVDNNGETLRNQAFRTQQYEIMAYLDALVRVRRVACYLIGIKGSCRTAPLHQVPLSKEGMGAFQHVPKEIILMIARWVWVTRDDPVWLN
jgi:hypothetical protein